MRTKIVIGAALLLLSIPVLKAEKKKSVLTELTSELNKAQKILEKYHDPFAPLQNQQLTPLTTKNPTKKSLAPSVPKTNKVNYGDDTPEIITFSLLGYIESTSGESRAILNAEGVGDFVVKGGEVLSLSKDNKTVTRILVSKVADGFISLQIEGQPGVTEVR